ncbi:hypothetical protein [Maritalea sp.]|uniref:hypothetical protein n=1 Tax=Maritalea sp. TaxID=2003361 RepID=UPI003EF0C4A1
MNILKTISIAALAGAAMTAGAQAADPVTNYVSEAPVYATPGFDWNRYYIGLNSSYIVSGTNYWGIGGVAGINIQDGSMVYGGELEASARIIGGNISGGIYEATVRAGVLVSDDVLLYATGGGGSYNGVGVGLVGAGMEFAVAQDVTIGAEYNYLFDNGGTVAHEVDGKIRWYFN